MAYATYTDVRTITGITVAEASNDTLTTLITYATAHINSIITARVPDENVQYVDTWKQNTLDGVNTTFYTKKYPLADYDDDGTVSASDITVYYIKNNTRYDITVSSIDASLGKVVLASAPPTDIEGLYITYKYYLLPTGASSLLIKEALCFLTSSIAMSRLDLAFLTRFGLGKLNAGGLRGGTTPYSYYKSRSDELLKLINKNIMTVENLDITSDKPDLYDPRLLTGRENIL
jgi:hypothetical protein